MLRELYDKYDVFALSQGEKAEKIFYYRFYDQEPDAIAQMAESGWDVAARTLAAGSLPQAHVLRNFTRGL